MNVQTITDRVFEFIQNCRLNPDNWSFSSYPGGLETLYASCYSLMLYQYLGRLEELPAEEKRKWSDYIKSWQDPESGYFIGPELGADEVEIRKHSREHILQHLIVHVLPSLQLLGEKPRYPLKFAYRYLDLEYLSSWLNQRDWRDAWLEGNNLLFVGQLLLYLRDIEELASAQEALALFYKFLDTNVDPLTGLWGTNGYCSNANGLYGGYHQLLIYYYENHPIKHPERLVDVALSLQHDDGGFNPDGGGGACEDVDAIDILVNLYKRFDYRRPEIRLALRKALKQVLSMQMPDGGFVYRANKPFVHMGIRRTASMPNQSNLFPTWFRIHTLALTSEILTDDPISQWNWGFNRSCSMGWHENWDKAINPLSFSDRAEEWALASYQVIARRTSRLREKTRHYRHRIFG